MWSLLVVISWPNPDNTIFFLDSLRKGTFVITNNYSKKKIIIITYNDKQFCLKCNTVKLRIKYVEQIRSMSEVMCGYSVSRNAVVTSMAYIAHGNLNIRIHIDITGEMWFGVNMK